MSQRKFAFTITPEKKVVAAIRAAARRLGKDKLTMRQIDAEVVAYRRERRPK